MGNGLKNRKQLFEKLLNIDLDGENNKKEKQNNTYWEMLCCASKPLVPFIGAGISAWCYKTWKGLLESITKEIFPEKCFDIVKEALTCEEKPNIEKIDEFYWMEEIAECIFEEDREEYTKGTEKFKIKESNNNNEITKATEILKRLRSHIGEESDAKKRDARKALYREFDKAHLKEKGALPEYQRYFPILFPDLLITTNYDHALECCYPSILNYSYNDLEKKNKSSSENVDSGNTKQDRSWLFQAVCGKLENMNQRLNGKEISDQKVTIPDMPMLLKLHGSIEKVNDIALARKGYEKAYGGEMPELIEYICKNSTMLFLGYSLNDDRIMAKLKQCKEKNKDIHHFAFLPIEERKDKGKLESEYGIYPIYFDRKILYEYYNLDKERKYNYYDYFLGIFLENLARRQKKYPQPLELLWEKGRFDEENKKTEIKHNFWEKKPKRYIRYEEARQIWKNLNDASNTPMIAVIGEEGYGKSTLCRSIQTLQENEIDPLQFFFIDLRSCKTWDEFCIRVYEELNMIELEIPDIKNWKNFAEKVSDRCDVYWKSVLVLDHIDGLIGNEDGEIWKTIKNILMYWSRKKTRIIFVCGKYPEGIPCFIWDLKELKIEENKQLFFSACTSSQSRNISYLEKKVVSELFYKQSFRPQSITLLGKYANSKNDLTSLLEEWTMCYEQGDSGDYTIAWIFWYHLLNEQYYSDSYNGDQKNRIQDNLLWVWEILGDYPGIFPAQFFELLTDDLKDYKSKSLTNKTLMLMKNIGLCEEKVNEDQLILFNNMNGCVNNNFLKFAESSASYKEDSKDSKDSEDSKDSKDSKNSEDSEDSKDLEDDEEWFQGYHMHGWSVKLKQYIYKELKQSIDEDNGSNRFHSDPVFNILQFLLELSKKIDTNENRTQNRKLDIVLHYEIKNIVHFLCSCFSRMETNSENGGDNEIGQMVIDTVYNYSYYYHFIPNYSYSLVEYILGVIDGKGNQKLKIEDYKVAQLNLVMGDVQRLLGRKIVAETFYKKALFYCNKQIVENLTLSNIENHTKIYSIRANTMLAIDCYINECELDEEKKSGESLQIYREIDDKLGEAYWYQRKGEILYERISEYEEVSNNNNNQVLNRLNEIKEIYKKALKLYDDCDYETGKAYICKCIGDVFVKFMKLESNLEKKKTYFQDAANRYLKSYKYYCDNINWRGFANVIQAMETCCRYFDSEKSNKELGGRLYGYAEECYRWLGDIRGLADTLDYTGHEYAELGYNYKAINLWGESRDLWKVLDNNKKVKQIEEKIIRLRKKMDTER